MRNISFIKLCFLVSVLVLGCGFAQAQTSAFTYQGKLTDLSAPASGNYDFTFRLFDSASGGAQIGSDAVVDDVPVTNGIFTVNMDFGAAAFTNGGLRFLEISVRPGASTGAYTTLAPRQQITSSPYSIRAVNSASANSLSGACVLCVTDAQIQTVDGGKITGTVANSTNATTATNVSGIVQITNGGTGSSTQNFVDLSTNQTNIGGNKTFSGNLSGNGSGLTNVPGAIRWQSVSGLAQQAQPNNGYLTTNDAQATITLPTAPSVGDIVRVSSSGAGGWKIAQNAGQSIIGTNIGLFGVNWTPRESDRNWQSVASSADGSKLVAVVNGGQIYTSTDSGANWTPRESNRDWVSVASSADGSNLVAVVFGGQIYTSTDSGANWTPRESNRDWWSVASSDDGSRLVAVVFGGQIYTSTDLGANWTPRESNREWRSVASSDDGSKLVAVVNGGQIYTSTDSGVNWTPRESDRNWWSVASSADGSKLVAVVFGGRIWTSSPGNTVGTTGFLSGGQFSAIELQYIGNGQFLPLSHSGTISGF